MDTAQSAVVSRRVVLAGLGASGIGLALFSHGNSIVAQESTSAAGAGIATVEMAPGITRELFAAIPPSRAGGHTLYQARFTFNSGAEIMPHGHPGSVVLCVSSGVFGWTLVDGVAHVVRGSASGTTVTPEDVSESGTDIILNPGDAIYYEDDVVHTARGAGDEPAIVLGSLLLTTGEPIMIPAEMEAQDAPYWEPRELP